ncbi:MAG TPA: PIG-L family deacetylase [Blastocatellia bacterium]|nr:PIG-L family deacetylase [Blastocatellia bacterium]
MIPYSARRLVSSALVLLLIIVWPAAPLAVRSLADNRPAEDRGAMALGQAIKRLGVVASVLHTGAHPDDEDSGLLAYLARGRQARTAYLSLTRGDGGQNLIGPELYEALGVMRTEELLAARRLDGAQQFFSRAFDFGFSKSRAETLAKWDREAVLADMVRVIRTFRPLVIVSAWSGTPNDGHGHHQASGLLTQEAYRAAADPSRFPEQISEGLRVWQARKLYVRSFDGAASPREFLPSLSTVSLNTGEFDPLLGCSYYEIAARGRSQHRSQDQGTIEARGPRFSRLRLIDSKLGPIKNERDIFEDIDTSISGIAAYAGKATESLRAELSNVQSAAAEARNKYNPLQPNLVAPAIASGLQKLRSVREKLKASAVMSMTEAERAETDLLLAQKEADFEDALAKSAGVVVDCLTDDEVVTAGQTFTVTLNAYANAPARLSGFGLTATAGWTVNKKSEKTSEVDGRLVLQAEYTVTVGPQVEPTQPYWLASAPRRDMFTIDKPAKGASGIEPMSTAPLNAVVDFDIDGANVKATQESQYRYADRALGEIRHELKAAPAVSVNLSPEILVYPKSAPAVEREVSVSVTNNQKGGVRGSVSLQKPNDWQSTPASANFELKHEGERASFSFMVKAPGGSAETRQPISAIANIDGRQYLSGYQIVSYPHIEPRFIYHEAKTEGEVIDVKVAPGLKVGYIEGSGDDFGAALKRIGVDVKTIDSKELASGDLSVYDTIVAGVRVYEVRPDVIANNARLMDYVNRGGAYIVQYSRGNFETGGFAPYRIGREQVENSRQPAQRGRQQDREPRLMYLSEADITGALTKSATKPRVGYVGGDSDSLMQSMKSGGLDPKALPVTDIGGDLSQFDVIIVGSASSSKPELTQYNSQLLDYSRRKLVILAYTQQQFINGDFPTFPRPEARPFRVTDENAKVTILEPDHPRFNFPNKITQRDFDGWVQERGAYFLSDWDSHFKPLLACHDPGEPDLKGGEVIAEYGKGLYVYTAYAWFRQLPKGVPGAYRLIANLVSLPKARLARAQSPR